jgi:cytochrome c2
VAPTATSSAGGSQASTPTKEVAPTATLGFGGTKETPAALDGKALVQERCTKCHDLTRIQQAKRTPDLWKATVQRMMGHGAQLTQAEQDAVIAYLAKTYPQ